MNCPSQPVLENMGMHQHILLHNNPEHCSTQHISSYPCQHIYWKSLLVWWQNDSIWINICPRVMIVELHHAIVSTICLSVTSMRPTATGATGKTVLFNYNHVSTGLVSLKVLRMQGLLLEYLPDNHIRLFCNSKRWFEDVCIVIQVSLCRLLCLDCP